jgi:hypothetical protein
MKFGIGKKVTADLEENKMIVLEREIEADLFLLGATALEDKL